MTRQDKLEAQSSAVDLVEAVGRGAITPEGVEELLVDAVKQATALNAYILTPSETRHPAGAKGPLSGVPVSVKDNVALDGFPVTGGTPAFSGLKLPENPVLGLLRAAGADFTGKTNLHELAFGITGQNGWRGPALNPFDPGRLAGGSSGGAAITVATGAAAIAVGTDTGGSCRVPAAHCGIVGFRPGTGRYPSGGIVELSPSRDTLGLLARTVADIRLVDSVICPGAGVTPDITPGNIRFGLVKPDAFGMGGDPGVLSAFSAAVDRLRRAGLDIVEVDFGDVIGADEACGFIIAVYETAASLHKLVEANTRLSFRDFVAEIRSPDVRGLIGSQSGPEAIPETLYREAVEKGLPDLRRKFAAVFAANAVEALIYPTSLFPAPEVSVGDSFDAGGVELPTFPAFTATTRPDSMSGQPSISLPCGLADGLPVGLQLVGPRGGDRTLLAIAEHVEQLLLPRPVPPRRNSDG